MPPTDGPDRPNVLWVCTDQHRWDALGCAGAPVETPAIDRLADRGVRFRHAYAQSPVCTPSRASFLTGRYPRTTGVRQNGQAIPESEVPVTRLCSEAGYTCGLSGKLHLAPLDAESTTPAEREPARRIDDGYGSVHWAGTPEPGNRASQYSQWLSGHDVDPTTEPLAECEHVHRGLPSEYHQTTWCFERAVEFVGTGEADPWLFSVNPFDPHQPFDPPPAYLERYLDRLDEIEPPAFEPAQLDAVPAFQRAQHEGASGFDASAMDERDHRTIRAAYYAMIDHLDDQLGRLLDALEAAGELADTIVVFQGDHGELLGDHGIYRKGPQLYDPAVRVPLVVAGPGVESGVASDAMVELVDLAPTLCDATGVDPHPGMQGESLWPLLSGDVDPDEHRDEVYAEFYNAPPYDLGSLARAEGVDAAVEVAMDDGRYGRAPFPTDWRRANLTMLRTREYKLVRYHGLDTGELYDLEADPGERENRWNDPEYDDVRRELLARMTDRMAWTADPLPERTGGW